MDQNQTAKVVFMPSGRRGSFPVGTPVLRAAQQLGVDIDSICGGRGICGRCQIVQATGSFPKHGIESLPEHLSAFTETEHRYEKRKTAMADGRRLGCQALIQGDMVVDVPPESQVHKQIVRKAADLRAITLDTAVKLYYIEVEEADMHHPKGDYQRLCEALQHEWQLEGLHCGLPLLNTLQATLRAGQWKVTAAVHAGQEVIALWPGFRETVYGLAIDIGSTTIAAHLCDLVTGAVVHSGSMMNPQIRFGEDLMSRVSYIMMHPEGAQAMTDAVRTGLRNLAGQIAAETGISTEDILELTLVGNPVMHHILLGINPVELGGAPFALATDEALNIPASALELGLHPGAMAYVLPCIAGHVGADAAAMVLSEEPFLQDEITLLVDVGTNAEIVLGNRERLLACSSPTGPAFEGAQISAGQRAAPGAIERVRIDPVTKEPRIRVIGAEPWSDEPGFAAAVQAIGVNGICGSGIIEVVAEMYLAGIISSDGVIDGALADQTPRVVADGRTWSYVLHDGGESGQHIAITQNDVRQIQLAKAALYAGVKLLMDHRGVPAVERIRLAGAFGSHIDVRHAMVLGLIPDCPLDQVASAGNAAGTGARIALLNQGGRRTIETVVRTIEKIETAVEPKFQEYFVDAMAFPNRSDDFPHLFSVVERPAPKAAAATGAAGERRRRRGRS
ncbi:MAG TPA: ASKHA domain-containing protein [Thiolinea sp.]|nr:ASKHA domain-containing protein [Thiolinea sp.]